MKKSAIVLFAISIFTIAACTPEPAGPACNNDDDCTKSGDICIDETCQPAQCNDNIDCDLSVRGDAVARVAGTSCVDDNLVTIVGFDGAEVCITGEDDAVGCGAGFSAADAEAPGGGTVSVCVSGDGVCDEGKCT